MFTDESSRVQEKYRCRHVSSSSAGSVGGSKSGGEVAAVELHPHSRLSAERDVVVGGRWSPREDPAGAALPGGP